MKKPIKMTLIIVGVFLLVLVVFLAILTRPSDEKEKKARQPSPARNVGVGAEAPTPEARIETREATAEEIAKAKVQALATHFAERFGTYSNDGNFENVVDLYPFMTSLMKNWAKEYVEKLRKETQRATYEGITTRAISVSINSLNLDEGKAETLIKTQRTEIKADSPEPKVYYQDLRLELFEVGGDWKVDGAYWLRD